MTTKRKGSVVRQKRSHKARTTQTLSRQRHAPSKQAILVLGMHRSGTSALTRVLSFLGADLPKNILGPGHGNDTGHWESIDLVTIHDEMLNSAGTSWQDWRAFNTEWIKCASAPIFKQRILAVLRQDYPTSPLFAVKDPRICRFVPLWRDVLEEFNTTPIPILPIRSPLEVAESLRQRNGFALTNSYLLWLRHVLDAERETRDLQRAIITYDALLDDWRAVVTHISERARLHWPRRSDTSELEIDRFLAHAHRHHETNDAQLQARADVVDWVKDAYGILRSMTRSTETAEHHHQLDRISAEFNNATNAFGLLIAGEAADTNSHINALTLERNTVQVALAERENALAEKSRSLQQTQEQITRNIARLQEAEQELIAIRGRASAAENSATARQQDAERRQKELDSTRILLRESQTHAQRLAGEIAHTKQQLNDALSELNDVSSDRNFLRAELAAARTFTQDTERKNNNNQRDINLLQKQLEEARDILHVTNSEAKKLRDALGEAQRESAHISAALKTTKKLLDDSNQNGAALREELARHHSTVATFAAEIRDLREANKKLKAEAHTSDLANQEIEQLRTLTRQTQERALRDTAIRDQEIARLTRELENARITAKALQEKQQVEERRLRSTTLTKARQWPFARLWRGSKRSRIPRETVAIGQSGLFDALWYLKRYPDVAATDQDPLTHYLLHGGAEGRDPHPLFDGKWYVEQYPGYKGSNLSPLGHYVIEGVRQGHDPNPLFDTDWYLKENAAFLIQSDNPLYHFWKTGAPLGLDPNPYFDVSWYLDQYLDVARARENALYHFLTHGWKEGRDPNPYFDTKWYIHKYQVQKVSELSPLAYYLQKGLELGHETNPQGRYSSVGRPKDYSAIEATYDRLSISPTWREALQRQALSANEREVLVLGNIETALARATRGVCIYMTYRDRPDLHLRHEITTEALSRAGYVIVLINNCESNATQFAQSAWAKSDVVIVRRNVGRDFGAWVDFIAKHYRALAGTKSIVLLNDSVIGPTANFEAVLGKIDQSANDIVGLSESYQNGYHLQSSFLHLKPSLFWNERFLSWIATYPHPDDKSEVIRLGEIGFSTAMRSRGISIGSLISYEEAATSAEKKAMNALSHPLLDDQGTNYYRDLINDISRGVPRNPQHAFWDSLLDLGYPFLKRELFAVNPEGVPLLTNFEAVLQGQEQLIACVADEFTTTRKLYTTNQGLDTLLNSPPK